MIDDMPRNRANFVPLSPVSFLERAAMIYPGKVAVRHGRLAYTYREFEARARRLASALARHGVGRGDTVAVMAPNVPALLEAHYAVPALGAVLNPLNVRLDAPAIAFCLEHGGARVLLTDAEFAPVVKAALAKLAQPPLVIDIDDSEGPPGERVGTIRYEDLLAEGDPAFAWPGPRDEWDAIALLYTSGTTGDPKGVVYHHRGAFLNAMGNAMGMRVGPDSVYLWTLPMFHCCGWTFTWAVTAACATHVCLRRVDPKLVFRAIVDHRVTLMCGAPVVLTILIHAPAEAKLLFDHVVDVATGGAAPPSTVIAAMESMGFRVTHLYGLTESYGPATVCAFQDDWHGLDLVARSRMMARQGVPIPTLAGMQVGDPETGEPVPRDGVTLGEVMLRGNTIMKGYLRNEAATAKAFAHDWYHSGDLAVWHPDNYIEIKDRSKDIIITGGENVSSREVEDIVSTHPEVAAVAVVGLADPTWGEQVCAVVVWKSGNAGTVGRTADDLAHDLTAWTEGRMAGFKRPRTVVSVPELPLNASGKVDKRVIRERLDQV